MSIDVAAIANLHTYDLYEADDGLDELLAVWEAERIIRRTRNHTIERERCRRSFPYFLRYVKIPDVHSGEMIRMKLWPHVLRIAHDWQGGDSWIEGKARQMGYTWILAAYDVWKATFHHYSNILSFSIGQRESTALGKRIRLVNENLPDWLRVEITAYSTKAIEWGATEAIIQTLPSTANAGRGETANVVQTDEWAFHQNAAEHYSSYRPALADGGQHLAVSTGNGVNNLFASFFRRNDDKIPYNKRFLGWATRPGRDRDWYERERNAYLAMSIEADFEDEMFGRHPKLFERENPTDIAEMFMVFMGLVFDVFDRAIHLVPTPFEWRACRFRVAGVDPGQGDPAAINVIGESEYQHAHTFGEKNWPGSNTEDDITSYLMQWHKQAPFHGVFVDSNEGTLISTLVARGLPAVPANKDRETGIGHVWGRMMAQSLTFDAQLRYTIRDIESYQWSTTSSVATGERWQTSTPVDNHADHPDAFRYGLVGLAQLKSAAGVMPKYGAQPEFRKTVQLPEQEHKPQLKQVREGDQVGYRDPGVRPRRRRSGPDLRNRGRGSMRGLHGLRRRPR